ncbi:MAG: polyprenyl synthetase family protein [Lachnospiraceae bacterium]|nr:polyprenyl synthetase family protein [Lachnospiraceae bacterium]
MNFSEMLAQKTTEIEAVVYRYLPEEKGFQKEIFSAMKYSVSSGGKRLRPMLMQEVYQMFSGESKAIGPFMAALEMIHTYSLIHDDLPAMDNDDYRRGRLTTHKVYGEAIAILAGDALLNYAFEIAAGAFDVEENAQMVGKALQILTAKAGVYGMIGGQVVDVLSEKKQEQITKEKLDFIYELKTGALIECAMTIGAVLAGASDEEVRQVEAVAKKVGLAFQIQDDILDVIGTMEELGKPIGSDEKNEKSTYVSFVGIEAAQKEVQKLSEEAVEILDLLPADNPFLRELILSLIHRKK